MARKLEREKARELRFQGKSYSEIKSLLGTSKGTLSSWLKDMPLTKEQMSKVRDFSPRRIESFRATMKRKSDTRMNFAYEKAKKDIGILTKRDLFIAGLYLYWGEGTKAEKGGVTITNTDPAVIKAFIMWMKIMNYPMEDIRIRLHLYVDMNIESETEYWSQELSIPKSRFCKPHIKKSLLTGLNYKTGFGHGTCNLKFGNMAEWEYIIMALKRIRELHSRP